MPASLSKAAMDSAQSSHFVTSVYIPYNELASAPVTLRVGNVPVTIVLTSSSICTVSVPSRFVIADSMSSGDRVLSVKANLGTPFIISYRGNECEVRLGRKITVTDR